MGMLGKALKLGVLAKVVQIVQREASKPQNRKRATVVLNKYKARRAGGAGPAAGTSSSARHADDSSGGPVS